MPGAVVTPAIPKVPPLNGCCWPVRRERRRRKAHRGFSPATIHTAVLPLGSPLAGRVMLPPTSSLVFITTVLGGCTGNEPAALSPRAAIDILAARAVASTRSSWARPGLPAANRSGLATKPCRRHIPSISMGSSVTLLPAASRETCVRIVAGMCRIKDERARPCCHVCRREARSD